VAKHLPDDVRARLLAGNRVEEDRRWPGRLIPEGHQVMAQRNDEDRAALPSLAPADFYDPVIEAYKKDVDRTLLRENLKLTVDERVRKAQSVHQSIARARGAAWQEQPARAGREGP
jgi:hypothetical protein